MPKLRNEQFERLRETFAATDILDWNDISEFLDKVKRDAPDPRSEEAFSNDLSNGAAFITYDFGIDGVSIEISKYANFLESIQPGIPLHFIGGDFYDKADVVLKPEWQRFKIDGFNGWSKWFGGEWFSKLYYEEMPEGSEISSAVAREIWRQTVTFADHLGHYLSEQQISLIVPVNIPTNPGNLAAELAIVIVSEALELDVISSNHDFYWEGGKPASERKPNDPPGVRDHFFKNIDNKPFFNLFKRIYPWNGRRWLQVNINTPQSEALINTFGFDRENVFELGTAISDKFFEPFDENDVKNTRLRMAYILSDGSPVIKPVAIDDHLNNLSAWMNAQKPVVCGARPGLELDPTNDGTVYCLQPTRVIARKRIEMDVDLLRTLLHHPPFQEAFANNPARQLVLHVTGPVPIEHQADLETILRAFQDLLNAVPAGVADRVFLAFSVGTETHPALAANQLENLCIEEIYRLATVILFPSETEGRGLPIIESSACGVPIICSRYYPEEVFAEVVGEGLADEEQIKYLLFPEDGFQPDFLDQAADLILKPETAVPIKKHNKNAVRLRYSTEMIKNKFLQFFEALREK